MNENRKSQRLSHHATINITFASGETMKAQTQDMSDGGLLIKCTNHPRLTIGDKAEVIVLGIQEAISRPVKIVRIDSHSSFAVKFTIE